MSTYQFDPAILEITGINAIDNPLFSSVCVHRVNLGDVQALENDSGLKELVSSKSGIGVVDSAKEIVLLPPGSSAEVDFWVLGDGQVVLTHNPPSIADISRYPTLAQFLEAWSIKRAAEAEIGTPHGVILANLKTHGQEEAFLERCEEAGVPAEEVVFLDLEYPAIDRILRADQSSLAPISIRVSRIESLSSVLMALEQDHSFRKPHSIFLDPVGTEDPKTSWPLPKEQVQKMYELSPEIQFILCCPSRWGRDDQIDPLATRLQESGLKPPMIMTDLDKVSTWAPYL